MYNFTIEIKSDNNIVGYNYEHKLHAFINEHISQKGYGSQIKSYIHSNLKESQMDICKQPCGIWGRGGIKFSTNPCFTIRTNDLEVAQSIVRNIKVGQPVFDKFVVVDYYADKVEALDDVKTFITYYSSPILICDRYNNTKHIPDNELHNVETYLKNNVLNRAQKMGIELGDFNIRIDKQYKCCDIMPKRNNPSNFNTAYKSVGRNLVLTITGTTQAKDFIYLNGLGRQIGLGFGFLNIKH